MGTLNDGLGCFPLDYGDYPPQSDSHASPDGIRSLIRVGKPVGPLAFSVLYPQQSAHEAIPKGISERTSYSGVLLAFHSDPQLIPALLKVRGFGPPQRLTAASTWPWVDHLRFGSIARD